MTRVKVRKEKWAERCEICHKRDCYDPERNYCSRCSKIQQLQQNLPESTNANVDAFGRSLMVGYIEVQAEMLREANKDNNNYIDALDILFTWVIKGFTKTFILSFIIFSILFLLLAFFESIKNFEQVCSLIVFVFFIALFFGFWGLIIGFICASHLIAFTCLKELFRKRKTQDKS